MSWINKNVWIDEPEDEGVIHFKFLRRVKRKTKIKRLLGMVNKIWFDIVNGDVIFTRKDFRKSRIKRIFVYGFEEKDS